MTIDQTGKSVEIDLDEDRDVPRFPATTEVVIIDEDTGKPADDIVDEDAGALDTLPNRARPNADGSITLPLRYPVSVVSKLNNEIKERRFEELTFHRLNGKDQRVIGAASKEQLAPVAFAQSCRINQARMNALYDKMDAADIADCGRVLNHFLTSGPRTGR